MIVLQEANSIHSDARIELAFAVDDVDPMKQKLRDRAVVEQRRLGNAIGTTDPVGARLNSYRLRPKRSTE